MSTFNDLEQMAKAKFAEDEKAAKAWFGTNWAPLGVGVVLGLIAAAVIHHL